MPAPNQLVFTGRMPSCYPSNTMRCVTANELQAQVDAQCDRLVEVHLSMRIPSQAAFLEADVAAHRSEMKFAWYIFTVCQNPNCME